MLAAMRELSAQYPRYGYRCIRVLPGCEGFELSWSRTHRLWRQAGLLVPRKRPRKRIHTPFKANMVWAYDFVFDTTASGQQIKCLRSWTNTHGSAWPSMSPGPSVPSG